MQTADRAEAYAKNARRTSAVKLAFCTRGEPAKALLPPHVERTSGKDKPDCPADVLCEGRIILIKLVERGQRHVLGKVGAATTIGQHARTAQRGLARHAIASRMAAEVRVDLDLAQCLANLGARHAGELDPGEPGEFRR